LSQITVLKFGSSVLRTRADLPNAVHEIYRWFRLGHSVVAVVSAIGEGTDALLREARELATEPEPYATAELLATGERASAALLGIALDRAGIPARVLNPREIGLTAVGSPLDSELVSVNTDRVRELLVDHPVLVVPGFFGTDSEGRTHALGRGGSDLTAVYLSKALQADSCRLIKDVDGVYEGDPAAVSTESSAAAGRVRRYVSLDYATALEVATQLIQPKAVDFLRLHGGRVQVAGHAKGYETVVHSGNIELGDPPRAKPLKVLLLGLGTVGMGVYQRLLANAQDFEVVGVLIRDRGKYERQGIPAGLLRTRVDQTLKLRADVVVDLLPGMEPSLNLAQHFLVIGVPVISANKTLIAESGAQLVTLANRTSASLHFSAAVGGAAPMIEAVERTADRGIESIAAVLNGTCNFILDRIGRGVSLSEAIEEAQRAGFAEHDPTEDLSGRDAARKLRILVRHAFGAEPRELTIEPLDEAAVERIHGRDRRGRPLRQVARAVISTGILRGHVRLEEVSPQSPFSQLRDEWNALEITTKHGAVQRVAGRGAGGRPTTEAVIADLFEVRRRLMAAVT
jgi:homoserine dehydrogenase